MTALRQPQGIGLDGWGVPKVLINFFLGFLMQGHDGRAQAVSYAPIMVAWTRTGQFMPTGIETRYRFLYHAAGRAVRPSAPQAAAIILDKKPDLDL